MAEPQVEAPVVIRSARTGRPSQHSRAYKPNELVRIETRIPAHLAQRLYDAAHQSGRPVTAVHADLLARALNDDGAGEGAVD